MTRRFILALHSLLFITACNSQPTESRRDQNALIIELNEESIELLQNAIARLLNGQVIAISNEAFINKSFLSVHRSHLTGRDLGTAHLFRLVKNSDICILIYENTKERVALPTTFKCTYNI